VGGETVFSYSGSTMAQGISFEILPIHLMLAIIGLNIGL